MIDLVVFDMAGTTVSDRDYVANAFQKAFQNHDLLVSEMEVNPLMGYPKPIAIQMVLGKQEIEFDEELVNKIHKDFVGEMIDFYEYSPFVKAMPDAEDIFFYFKERGVPIALNTGFSKNIAQTIIDRFQWKQRGLIDEFIASDEVEKGRPYADMIETLKKRVGVGEESIIMKVGDTVADILEGQNANCKYVVAVTTGATPKEVLNEYSPTHIISSLKEIPGILEMVQHV